MTAVWAVLGLAVLGAACGSRGEAAGAAESGAPPPPVIVHDGDGALLHPAHPEHFPTVAATRHDAVHELRVTGLVAPDVSRTVPVVSLASGRVIDVRVQLGDRVTKGQVLLRLDSAEVSGALADDRKAHVEMDRAQAAAARAQDLFDHRALAKKDLELAQADAAKAAADLADADTRLRVLGVSGSQASPGAIEIIAPVSGVITEQNVTMGGGVRTLDNSPNLFTISDLSTVWVLCDVYEADLATVTEGDQADIRLTAMPGRVLSGHISNIGAVLDPATHTAKVRIEVPNPGLLRIGLFVSAIIHGRATEPRAVVPTTAIVHLHDRAWVYVEVAPGEFRRQEVLTGDTVTGGQEIRVGLKPGDRVVADALAFQNSVDQ